MKKKLVSVVMSAYNEEGKWFIKSIESIINQTYKYLEIIIIIDNPNRKDLIDIAYKYKSIDSRIKVIINKINKGLVYCLNKGIKISKGELIARMDADDISNSRRIEKQVKYLNENKECILVGTQMILINENDEFIERSNKLPTKYNDIKKVLKYTNVICHPSIMFIKDFVIGIGVYREIKYAEDYDLITRIVINKGIVSNLEEELIYYRIRKNGITNSNSQIQFNSEKYIKKNYKKGKIPKIDEQYCCNKKINFIDKINKKIDIIKYKIFMKKFKYI